EGRGTKRDSVPHIPGGRHGRVRGQVRVLPGRLLMLDLGLSSSQKKRFHALLASHHSIYIRLQIMDLEHGYLDDISDQLIDGQVTVDASADVTRSLSLDLLDPRNTLHLDSDSPSAGALFADRMIRVIY